MPQESRVQTVGKAGGERSVPEEKDIHAAPSLAVRGCDWRAVVLRR